MYMGWNPFHKEIILHSSKEHNAQSQVRKAILQGVLEDNLQIEQPGPASRLSTPPSAYQPRNRVLAVFLLTVMLVAGFFIGDPVVQREQSVEIATTHDATLPWGRILFRQSMRTVGRQDNPLYVTNSALTGQPSTHFDAHMLLNYDFLLNRNQVRLSSVFGLDVKTIVIDPGHGGRDPGAIGSQGTLEKEIVLDIALRLRDLLMKSGHYRVLLTRDKDVFVSLADRVKFSNLSHADLFISLHINALPQKEFNVTETFYFGPPSDSYTLQLAEQENRGSEIKTGDFKNMIKKIGDLLKEQESASLAAILQHSLFSNMKKYDRVIADNGIKIAPFVVLLGVDAPSVLVEISCISKQEEEVNLNSPTYRKAITSSLNKGLTGYLIQRNTQVVKGDDNGKKILNKNS